MARFRLSIVLLFLSVAVFAQERETYVGAILTADFEKDISRKMRISFEEELRLMDNQVNFDRLASTIGLDYNILGKKMKAGIYYCYIYMFNNNYYYENRHRYYFSLSYKETVGKFTLSWRGRVQGTYRDENRGEYEINPKYIFRNRLQSEYSLFGSTWKPYLFCELSNSLNDPLGNEIYKMRIQGGTTWRLDRTTYLEFFLRADEYFFGNDPRVFSVGAGYKKSF